MTTRSLFAMLAAATLTLAVAASAVAHDMEGMDMGNSGDSSNSGAFGQMGKHMDMGPHMTMTPVRAATPQDTARAEQIISEMREKLGKYQDYKAAEADGYLPYMESVPQDVYHFANHQQTAAEYLGDIDIARPGALLYEKKTFGGYRLVGAMYSAPASYTPEQLDKIIPLGIARWHAHTNICLPAGITEKDVFAGNVHRARPDITSTSDRNGGWNAGAGERMRFGYFADPRFGFNGTISTQAECEAAAGNFHPQIFGWMVHAYPFAGTDDLKVSFGTDAP